MLLNSTWHSGLCNNLISKVFDNKCYTFEGLSNALDKLVRRIS
jgi:hypothetical protein